MQTVVLQYTAGALTEGMSFDIFRLSYLDAEFEKVLHDLKNSRGGYREDIIGYRLKTMIEFQPLQADKAKLFFLYKFATGTNRAVVSSDFGTRQVNLVESDLKFDFLNKAKVGDAFSLDLIDEQVSTIGDDGSTRVLKTTYTPGGDTAEGTYYVDLVNENDIQLTRKFLKFSGGARGDSVLGYLHTPPIEFGPVANYAKKIWLRDFCLWGKKQLDTTLSDPVNGQVYDVVCLEMGIKWDFVNGIKDAFSTKLRFAEKNARVTAEIAISTSPPPSPGGEFILDTDTLDGGKVLG